jgi:hypothetical protein
MERWAANTLRTFGLIVMASVVIVIAVGLALLGWCFAILSSGDQHGRANPQSINAFSIGIAAAIIVLVVGIVAIAAMARVIFRESKIQDRNEDAGLPPLPPYSLIPPVSAPPIPARPNALSPSTSPQPNVILPAPVPLTAPPSVAPRRPVLDAATHLSPASRLAVDRLILAIAAQVSVQVIVGVVEWLWAAQITMPRFRLHGVLLLAWSLAASAPYILLAITLRRRPGTTAFSFCLVVPGFRSFFGLFGQTASLILFLRTFHSGMPLVSAIPWSLDVLIFYLGWKAIRLTGIEPTPGRLILSTIDILLYSISLPIVFVLLNYFWP